MILLIILIIAKRNFGSSILSPMRMAIDKIREKRRRIWARKTPDLEANISNDDGFLMDDMYCKRILGHVPTPERVETPTYYKKKRRERAARLKNQDHKSTKERSRKANQGHRKTVSKEC